MLSRAALGVLFSPGVYHSQPLIEMVDSRVSDLLSREYQRAAIGAA